jgi:hypothetical protein
MPESSTAMPTPLPSSPLRPAAAAVAPTACCSRLALRTTGRLGEMLTTSGRLASWSTPDSGSVAAMPRSDR